VLEPEPEDEPELSPELPPIEPELPLPELPPIEPLEPVEPLEPPLELPLDPPVVPMEPLEPDPVLPEEEPEDDGLVTLPLLLPLAPAFLIAASNSERLNRPSPFVSAELKSSPGTAAASLESM